MKLLKMAFSNIKKRKSSAVTLFAIIIMSALMLSISLSLLLNVNSFYDRKRIELNTPDLTLFVEEGMWDEAIKIYAQNYPGVEKIEIGKSYIGSIKYKEGDKFVNHQFIIRNDAVKSDMASITVIDKLKTKPESSIILALNFKYSGFKAGDNFTIKTSTNTYEYSIYGFYEDAEIGASAMSICGAYIDNRSFDSLSNDFNFESSVNVLLKFDKIETTYNFLNDYSKNFQSISNATFSLDYEMSKMSAIMFAVIMSLILIIVAAIVLVISLIIVRFNINNNIQEDMKTLGALKSIGFTSKQIIFSIVFQFSFIAVLGSIAGVLLGGLMAGYVGNVVSATSGLLWSSAAFFAPALISCLAICAITALISYLTARKSKVITPIQALRSGIETHAFKKNYAPLEKTKLPVNLAVALKSFLGNIKNNITAFIVLFLFGFMTVLGFALYHNFVNDTSAFMQMIGVEPAEIQIGVRDDEFALNILDEIKTREGVLKTIKYDSFSATTDGKTIDLYVWEDISQKERNTLIEGRYPKYDNEIALTAVYKNILSKNIGDMVTIEYGGVSQSYYVTGITQGIGNAYPDMTLEGFSKLKVNPVLSWVYVSIGNSDSAYIDGYISGLVADYGDKINVTNIQEALNSTISSLKTPIAMATYLVTAINIFTVCFVFSLLINTIVRLRKKDLGIMKALGFTSGQLILQMLLSFLPTILAGTLLGALAGIFLTNPILGLMFSGMGIAKAMFIVSPSLTAVTELIQVVVCIIAVCLVSLKIKRIAPQKMITEQ